MPLLLLADETERCIDAYLDRGDLFALYDYGLRGVCVVTDEGDYFELQSLAVDPRYQGQGDYMLMYCDHPIYDDGVQLRDKVYFVKNLDQGEPYGTVPAFKKRHEEDPRLHGGRD